MTESSLKDLQSVLQVTLGDELIVENYVMKDLIPPGENFGSKIVSLHVTIKKGKQANSEDVYLVAKLPPIIKVQREMFDCSHAFKKEIFMYSKLIPFYRKLEIKNEIRGENVWNATPMYYGSRLSLNADKDFDDDAIILLENLKSKNYYCTDRRYGCDLAHAKVAVRAMARLHALGMAAKEKEPEFFEIIKDQAKCIVVNNSDEWMPSIEERIKDIADDPEIREYYEICARAKSINFLKSWFEVPPEPWATIIHGDFWANNMMYRKNSDNEPDDIKFVDFGNYLFLSPTRELTFFLACGLDHNAIGHIDQLLDLYYDTIIEQLSLLNCDVKLYSRETFDAKVVEDAFMEFTRCIACLKIITLDIEASDPNAHNVRNLLGQSASNETYRSRVRDLVRTYIKKGWFNV